jgi:hypothetical protein
MQTGAEKQEPKTGLSAALEMLLLIPPKLIANAMLVAFLAQIAVLMQVLFVE